MPGCETGGHEGATQHLVANLLTDILTTDIEFQNLFLNSTRRHHGCVCSSISIALAVLVPVYLESWLGFLNRQCLIRK